MKIFVYNYREFDEAVYFQRFSKEYGVEGNLVAGANIAGFLKVAEAMKAQGIAY